MWILLRWWVGSRVWDDDVVMEARRDVVEWAKAWRVEAPGGGGEG